MWFSGIGGAQCLSWIGLVSWTVFDPVGLGGNLSGVEAISLQNFTSHHGGWCHQNGGGTVAQGFWSGSIPEP